MWTSYDQNSHGSAFPFLYHRLFNSLAAAVTFFTGSIYQSVKLSIAILLCFGGVGMFRLVRTAGLSYFYALCAGILFIFANYTYTDWLIRGAAAEFTAMVFIPWLFYYCVQLLQGKKYSSFKVGLVLSGMFYSHIVIFYYAFFVCVVFYLSSFFQKNYFFTRRMYVEVASASAVVIFLCGLDAIGILLFKSMYNFHILTMGNWDPIYNFAAFGKYLIHRGYHWGSNFEGLSFEIGRVFNLASIFFTFLFILLFIKKKINSENMIPKLNLYKPILICALIYILLQIPISKFFYIYVPGSQFIQFPWRLLSFSTVISILLLCFSMNILSSHKAMEKYQNIFKIILILITGYQVVFGMTIFIKYGILDKNAIEEKMQPKNLIVSVEPLEYRPTNGVLPPIPKALIEISGKDCRVDQVFPKEAINRIMDADNLTLHVTGACEINYNQFVNPFTDILLYGNASIYRSNNATYRIVTVGNQKHYIMIKRMGLVQSVFTYIANYRNEIYE